jgi:large repetitive protein
MIRKLFRHVFGSHGTSGRSHKVRQGRRHLAMEPLECRQLLSITLPTIANVTLPAGTTVFVPLAGSDPGQTLSYSATASDYSKLTPVMMPQTNKTLELKVKINGVDQVMDFQLFDDLAPATTAHIEQLVNSGFYNGLSIYRNGKSNGNPFVIQGGNDPPTGAIKADQASIAEEFNPVLQFTAAGGLAMARSSAPGTSSTEFFVTEEPARFLDYNYTLFGVQTSGTSVISTIAAMPNQDSTQDPSGLGYLQTPLTITSASIITDTQKGVLELRAPTGVTGTVAVTVTARDGTNAPVTRSFDVTVAADSASNPANPFAAKIPTAPTSITYLPPTGTGSQTTSRNNSSSDTTLQFQVAGVTSGNLVEVLADGNPIGQATASGTSVVVTTDGSTKLADGAHKFTAIQIAKNQTVSITESGGSTATSQTADVPSLNSPATQLTVNTGSLNSTLSGHVYLDANNDGQQGDSESGLSGVTVRLRSQDGSGHLTEVVGVSPVQTDSAGSYSFQNLAAGTYEIEAVPSSKILVAQNTYQLQLAAGENQSGHDFRVLGLQPAEISLRLFLASTPPMIQVVQNAVQGSVPSGYSIAADKSAFNINTATSAAFTFAGAQVGATYAYTVSSGAGGTPVTGSGAVTSATQHVTGINVSSLPDGTLTFSATLTNTAGIVGKAVTATAALDQTRPIGYSLTADQSTLDATTAKSAGFTLANAEVGTTCTYTVRSSGDAAVTSVTGTRAVTSATQDITGIDVSSLPDGTITYSVSLTDAAGNVGAISIATATLKQTV